jgi:hypothetical protein
MSVAQLVAGHLKIAHVFGEPNQDERQALGLRAGSEMDQHVSKIAARTGKDILEVHAEEVQKQFRVRETLWATRLAPYDPQANSVLFICGADHCETFPETFDAERDKGQRLLPRLDVAFRNPLPVLRLGITP